MKNLLLTLLMFAASYGAFSQVNNLQVYNGMSVPIVVASVAVLDINPSCASGTSNAVNQVVMPGASIFVSPYVVGPSSACVAWGAVKIHTLGFTAGLGTVHPYFVPTFGAGGNWGTPSMTGYWYPLGSTPTMVLKIYP
jgi:hypothetical protein